MSIARTLPLFDQNSGQAWEERMTAGEYAVHYSSFTALPSTGAYCTVFASLEEAEAHAREQVAERPALRCTIYDHRGRFSAVRDIRGEAYKSGGDLSPRFRRWGGSILFFGGALMLIVDWSVDFKLSWPSLIGARLVIPGLILLVTEAILILHARIDRSRVAEGAR